MNWFYEYNGEQRGPVPDEEIERLLAQGMITAATLVWKDGLANWTPLGQARPTAAPVEARATAPGVAQCEACGRFFDASDLVPIAGRQVCAGCKPGMLQALEQGSYYGQASDPDRTGPAWEHRETLGFWVAARDTVKAVLLKPSETFDKMRAAGDLAGPFLFILLFGGAGYMAFQLYWTVAEQVMRAYNVGLMKGTELPGLAGMLGFVITARIVMAFVGAAIGSFMMSGIVHLSLIVFGGARRPYEATYRAIAYGAGSVALLNFIPVVGTIVAVPWLLVVVCVALARTHETDLWRAVLGVLVPLIFCCASCTALGAFFYSLAMRATHGH